MIRGQDVWNLAFTKDMELRRIGDREVFTYRHMQDNYYVMLRKTAQFHSDSIAFYDNWNRAYAYGEFRTMVDRLADSLAYDYGICKGAHVGLLLHNSIEFCVAFFAVCKLGAVTVPFPSKYRRPEVRALVEKADLQLFICSETFEGWADDYAFPVLYTKDEEKHYGFAHLPQAPEHTDICGGKPEEETIIMFTSGTTSDSKGVVLKNYNVMHATITYQRLLGITAEDKTIIPVPIYHITGLIALLGLFVYAGGTVHLYRRYDAKRILECVREHGITFMHGSPTVFNLLLDFREEFPKLPSIRMLACGSSFMPVEKMKKLHRWMPDMTFCTVYGMTETASPGTVFPYDAATSIYPASSGKPIPGMDLKIVDTEGNEVPDGTVGSVLIRGANITEYYYNLKSDLISEDGWLRTGDMGYSNEDAYIFFVDREKDMINRGGEKIWCTDVEDELLRIEGIKDAAVVGIPNEKYGEAAAALVVRESGSTVSEEEILELLKSRLARYKLPEKILFGPQIPKTPGLKTDKRTIRTMFQKGTAC